MKPISLAYVAAAALCLSSTAFAQSTTNLQAGDNAQTAPTHTPGTHHKKMKKTSTSSSGGAPSTGTATPSGPGAPVSASGSGQ
jgi:hypothetical protein